jgi:hypothetical protein
MGVAHKTKTPRIVSSAGGGVRWLLAFFLGVLLGSVGWYGVATVSNWAGLSHSDAGHPVERMDESVTALTQERDELRQKLTVLERSSQIDREANRLAQQELKKLQEERQEMEKDLEFMRNLVEGDAAGALRIKEFKLTAADEERAYNYRFTVRQKKEDFGWGKGSVDVSIEGTLGGEAKTLTLAELTGGEKKNHIFRFRHFQNFKGEIRLPDGFTPDSLVVKVLPETEKLMPVQESFDWVVGD